MTTSQRHPNFRRTVCVLTIPKSKTNLVLKMTLTPKNIRKPGLVSSKTPSSMKSHNMYKPAYRPA